jgi:hypothetical protein
MPQYDTDLASFLMRTGDTSQDAIRAPREQAIGAGKGLADLVGLGGWMRGETAGRPGFAPGPLYEALGDILSWIGPETKAGLPLAAIAKKGRDYAAKDALLAELKAAYAQHAPQHAGGYVPIYKVRETLDAPDTVFNDLLRGLVRQERPPVSVWADDPADYTAEQLAKGFTDHGRRYGRMTWSEE